MSSGAGTFTCVERSGGNGAEKLSECRQTSATPGNFGALNIGHFGSDSLGTSRSCDPPKTKERFANNIAVGADHDLEAIGSNPRVIDEYACVAGFLVPNAANGFTGTTDVEVGSGLYSGDTFSDGLGPRLTRLGSVPGTPSWMSDTTVIYSKTLDDIPLWDFLPTTVPPTWEVPRSCHPDQFDESASVPDRLDQHLAQYNHADRQLRLLERCLMHYQDMDWDDGGQYTPVDPPCVRLDNSDGTQDCSTSPGSGFSDPLFTRDTDPDEVPNLYDIQYTPRFGYVPQTSAAQGKAVPAEIERFRAVFIQRISAGCSQQGNCHLKFDPGVDFLGDPSPHSSIGGAADTLGVFVLPLNSLPNQLADENAPFKLNVNRFVELVR